MGVFRSSVVVAGFRCPTAGRSLIKIDPSGDRIYLEREGGVCDASIDT